MCLPSCGLAKVCTEVKVPLLEKKMEKSLLKIIPLVGFSNPVQSQRVQLSRGAKANLMRWITVELLGPLGSWSAKHNGRDTNRKQSILVTVKFQLEHHLREEARAAGGASPSFSCAAKERRSAPHLRHLTRLTRVGARLELCRHCCCCCCCCSCGCACRVNTPSGPGDS